MRRCSELESTWVWSLSDRGDGDAAVASRKACQIVRVVGNDDAATEADRCRDDESVDSQFATRTDGGKQMPSDSSSARSRRHDLREAARQDRIDRGVRAPTAVQLHEHCRWHSDGEVLLVCAAERGTHELMARQVLVWTCERGYRLAVKD